ncbi:hypothetical protein [Shimia sp.]|uniref:hypothetical protein n=1 Tax=Shimia sp. TaxID=1954381 RepID=UPI003564FA3B
MSDQKGSDDAKKRLDRLKAMQARHARQQPAEPAPAAEAPAPAQAAPAAPAAAGGRAQNPIVQKLRKALSTPEGGIDERKAKMLLQFIRTQAQDPAAPRHDMAKKLLDVVQNMDPEKRRRLLGALGQGGKGAAGQGAGKGLGAMLRGRAQAGGGAKAGAGKTGKAGGGDETATGEPWFDDLVNGL